MGQSFQAYFPKYLWKDFQSVPVPNQRSLEQKDFSIMSRNTLADVLFNRFVEQSAEMPGAVMDKVKEACSLLAIFMEQCGVQDFDKVMSTAVPGISITPTVQFDIPVAQRGVFLSRRIAVLRRAVRPLGFVLGIEEGNARLSMAYCPYLELPNKDIPFWKSDRFQTTVIVAVALAVAYFVVRPDKS